MVLDKNGLSLDDAADTAQKMKFSIKDFFTKCNQIRSFLRIWSHLLKKSLMKNFIFSAVFVSEQLQKYFRLQVVSELTMLLEIKEYKFLEQPIEKKIHKFLSAW